MSQRVGSGYLGSPDLLTSTENMEVITEKPAGWSVGYKCYKFSFDNYQDCHVIINNKTTLFLTARKGWNMDITDPLVYSFVIVEPDINFTWSSAY